MNFSPRSLAVLGSLFFFNPLAMATIPTDCGDDRECLIELAGSSCADGTPSYFTLTKRAGAKNLLIYFSGGGACWSKQSCEAGYAQTLTREEEPTDWTDGQGIHSKHDKKNPLATDYNIITVPYCTADAYTGNRTADYGTQRAPYVIRHVGYENVKKTLAAVKTLYPTPGKVVLAGCSAGGIGVTYHLRNLAATYPEARKYVVSDAGTPFRPPFVHEKNYRQIMASWGADTTLPTDPATGKPVEDLGQLAKYNTLQFPDTRFGFISSYSDKVMTFFAWAVGSPSPLTAVKKNIIDLSDNLLTKDAVNAKVFYTEGSVHCHTPSALGGSVSYGTDLGTWLASMVGDEHGWDNSRPDLANNFKDATASRVPTLKEVKALQGQ